MPLESGSARKKEACKGDHNGVFRSQRKESGVVIFGKAGHLPGMGDGGPRFGIHSNVGSHLG